MINTKKYMGLSLLAVSFIFMFNPTINVIDFLPDAVGCLFLSIALIQISDLNDSISDAAKLFRRMFFIQLLKFIAVFWLFGFVGITDRPSAILTATFTFSIFEIIIYIPAFKKLFYGFNYLAGRNNCEIKIDRLSKLTSFFIIYKSIITVLPEFAALSQFKSYNPGSKNPFNRIDWFSWIDLFRKFSFILVLIVGIIWLVTALNWLHRVLKNERFISVIKNKYESDVIPHEEIFIKRNLKLGFLFLCFGLGLFIDLRFEIPVDDMGNYLNINLIPDILAVVLIIIGLIIMRKYLGSIWKKSIIWGFIYGASSVFKEIISNKFYLQFSITDLMGDIEADRFYNIYTIVSVVDSILFIVFMLTLIFVFRDVINKYTGYSPITSNAHELQNIKEKISLTHKSLFGKFKFAFFIAVIMAFSDIAYVVLLPYYEFVWFINFVISAVAVFTFIPDILLVSEEIDYKYMLY